MRTDHTGARPARATRRRRLRTLLTVTGLLTVGMTVQIILTAPATPAAAQEAGPVAEGRELYFQSCAGCHGQRGEGSWRGPSLIGVGAASVDFQLTTGRMPLEEEERTADRGPPAFSPEQIDALVAFVTSLGGDGPPIPPVNMADTDLAEGKKLYQLHCAACHSATGAGGALTNGVTAPNLGAATPIQTAESIRVGPGAMPVFTQEELDEAQVNNIAAYVEHLNTTDDAGGFGIGRFGPVTEGLVAIVALAALVGVIRGIGQRAPRIRRRNQSGTEGGS